MAASKKKKSGAKMRIAEAGAKERILLAARQLFAERGFDSTPTKAIAELAGVPAGLIFYHYGTKESLLDAIFEGGNFADAVADATASGARLEGEESLAAISRQLSQWLVENHEHARLFVKEITSHRATAERLRQIRQEAVRCLAAHLESKSAAGQLPRLDFPMASHMFISSILLAALADGRWNADELANRQAAVLLRKVSPKATAKKARRSS